MIYFRVTYLYRSIILFSIILLFSNCVLSELGPRGKRYKYGGAYKGSDPSMSVGSKKIVFGSTRYGLGDICTIDANGNNWNRLTYTPGYEGEPEFSPDGSKIIYVSERDGNGEIYIMNADGSNQLRLTQYKHYDANPSFSPDGSKIIFSRNIPHPKTEILFSHLFIMNSDGTDTKRITYGDYWYADPKFSPDGKKIIYKTGWYGINDAIEIRMSNIDGSNENRITKKGLSHDLSFSPDGEKIIFIADWYDEGEWKLYTIELKTFALNRIPVPKNIYVDNPTFVKNGIKIMFLNGVDERGGKICIMNEDGTELSVISSTY